MSSVFANRFLFTPKFALPLILLVIICTNLGIWQLVRAHENTALLQLYQERSQSKPLEPIALDRANNDYRYFPIELNGYFDNDHTFLVDNKIYQGQAGYEVITPFKSNSTTKAILVDRGWISQAAGGRHDLPTIDPITTPVTISGIIFPQPGYFSIGSLYDEKNAQWPLVMQHIDIPAFAHALNSDLYPYILMLNAQSPYGFPHDWDPANLLSGKHLMYAVQWFVAAAIFLIVFFMVGIHRRN